MADVVLDPGVGLAILQSAGAMRVLGGLTAAESRRWLPWRALTFTIGGLVLLGFIYASWLTSPERIVGHLVLFFFTLWILLLVVTTVATTQDMVAAEITRGTAAWVVAKPVGRPAFVISKFVAMVPVVVVAMVGIPGMAARFVLVAAEGKGRTEFRADDVLRLISEPGMRGEYTTVPEMGDYLGTLGLLVMILLVVTAAMVLLGCVLRRATTILAVGMLVPLAMLILEPAGVDHQIVSLTPAWLMESFIEGARDNPAPVLGPVLVGVVWIVGLLGLASWWFNRREL